MRTIWQKGEYQAAPDLLNTLKNGDTAEARNYRGMPRVSWGVLMKVSAIISAPSPSIRPMPKYVNTGEAWLVKGRPDLAKAQLKTIATLCGQRCEEYRDLGPLSTVILNPE